MTDLIITGLIAYALFAIGAYFKEKNIAWASIIAAILCAIATIKFVFGLFGSILSIVGGILGILLSLIILLIVFAIPVAIVLLVAKGLHDKM